MKTLFSLFQIVWQLPQTIVGLILLLLVWVFGKILLIESQHGVMFVKVNKLPFGDGVSLGHVIFYVRHYYTSNGQPTTTEAKLFDRSIALHEYGHWLVGCLLGPAYLVVALLCMAYSSLFERKKEYRQRVFESWADRKAGTWTKKKNYSFWINQ